MPDELATGGCLCGAFTYEFDKSRVVSAHHCHCTDCQKSTGSGKATIVFVPTEALRTAGELKSFEVTGTDGSHVNRGFCPECGSPLISWLTEMPELRFVKAGGLDDSSWLTISSSYWHDSAQPWSPADESLKSFPRNPTE